MNARATQVLVYYRVRGADASQAIAAVAHFQSSVRAAMPGLACSLSRRADDAGELFTLMETYTHASAPVARWQQEIERLAGAQLGAWIVGERHVEAFVTCA